VLFFAFLLRGLSLPAHEFLRGLLFVYGVQLHQLTPNSISTLLVLLLFVSRFWGSNPTFFSGNSSFGSTSVSLYQRSLNWAEMLSLSVLNLSTWSFPWLPQYKVGGLNGFILKTERSLPLTSTALPLLMPPKK
jgi:hypothetical protein